MALVAGAASAETMVDHRPAIDAKRSEIDAARAVFRTAGCDSLSPSFYDAKCARLAGDIDMRESEFGMLRRERDEALGVTTKASSLTRTRATIAGGSLIVLGAASPPAPSVTIEPAATSPLADIPLRDLSERGPVRVVGPTFLPDQEAAIDLRAPGRNPAP